MDDKSESVCAIIDRFMTSEGTDTLILAFTSKTGQSVAHNSQNFFYFRFSVREKTYSGILLA